MVVYISSQNISSRDTQSAYVSSVDPLTPHDTAPVLSRTAHTVIAVCLGFILVFGCLNNLFVLLIFARFRSLWTPINLILLNISVSDVLVCLLGTPFSFASSLYGKWLLGQHGCEWYGFANSLFGEFASVGKDARVTGFNCHLTLISSTFFVMCTNYSVYS